MAQSERPVSSTPTRVPRRTLVAAGGWSVPVVAAATAAPAYAASPCGTLYDYTLDWTTAAYTRSSGVAAYAQLNPVQAGGDVIYVHFTTVATGTTGNNIDTARNLTLSSVGTAGSTQDPIVTNLGGTGQRGIRLQHNERASGIANAQDLRISFRTGTSPTSSPVWVRNTSFYLTDIDGLSSNGNIYADRVSLTVNPTAAEHVKDTNVAATISGGNTTSNVSVVGAGSDGDPWRLVNAADNTASNNNIAETSPGTRVRVTYDNVVTRSMQELSLKYWTSVNATIYHRMYLTNITFKARRIFCG